MKFNNYKEYVDATKEFYKDRDLTIDPALMVLTKDVFELFDGVIDFGAGSVDLVNQKDGCKCKPTFSDK